MDIVVLSLAVIFGSLGAGYLLQYYLLQRQSVTTTDLQDAARRLQMLFVVTFSPLILLLAFWSFEPATMALFSLPIVGAVGLLVGGGLAWQASRWLGLDGRGQGGMFVSGMFSNLGSIGALLCFFFFGEPGFVLASLYRLFEPVIYWTFGFPFASLLGRGEPLHVGRVVREGLANPLTFVPMMGIGAGLLLSFSGWERPLVLGTVNQLLIPLGAAVLTFAVGLTLRFSNVALHPRPILTITAVKFVAVPAVVVALGLMLGYGAVNGGLPLKVALVQASAPVAVLALVAPALFDVDEGVTQACWLTSTALLVLVVPLLSQVLTLF